MSPPSISSYGREGKQAIHADSFLYPSCFYSVCHSAGIVAVETPHSLPDFACSTHVGR